MSKFQQRHYEAIAEVLRDVCPEPHWDANKKAQWDVIVNRLASMFSGDNSMFDRGRFERACVPGANVKARTK